MHFSLTFLALLLSVNVARSAIYGIDNRKNLTDESDPRWIELAKSVAVMVDDRKFHAVKKETTSLKCESQKEYFNLCSDVHFAREPKFGDCTGFLVAPDLLVTARHCVPKITTCERYRWAFGADDRSKFTSNSIELKNKHIYRCVEILDHSPVGTVYRDFAVVRLDRPVLGRKPLKLNLKDDLRLGDRLAVVGHPSGMLLKIAKGGYVTKITPVAARATLDAFGGNSGSPVINERTLEVEGILVAGEVDIRYDRKRGCWRDKYFAHDEGTGERITLMKEVSLP